MDRDRHRAPLGVATLLLGLGACEAPGPELPELVEVGQHLRVGVPDEAPPVCAGTWPYMDRYVGVLKELHEVSGDHQVDYYWLPDFDNYGVCTRGQGCAYPGTAYSKAAIEEHELVHVIRWIHGGSYSFIEEGAAEYWGADDMQSRPIQGETAEAILQADGAILDGSYYGRAGHFVSYLASEHGEDQLLAFTRESRHKDELDAFKGTFEAIYGFSIDEAVEQYASSYRSCPRWLFRSMEGVCSSQPTLRCDDSGDLRSRVLVSCDSQGTIGPRNGEIFAHVVFDIPFDTDVVFRVIGPAEGTAFVRQCQSSCRSWNWRMVDLNTEGVLDRFPQGRYVMRLSLPEGTAGEFEIVGEGMCSE